MKTKFIHLITYIFFALLIASCSLDNVDVNNQGDILEEFLVQDETSAKAVLNRVYNNFKSYEIVRFSIALMVSGTEQTIIEDLLSVSNFKNNNVQTKIVTVSDDIFPKLFYIINTSNYLITQVEAGKAGDEISPKTKNEILGEAKTLRAFARFMLLRAYGQFYDINSKYGIVISNKPVIAADQLPRSSVKESYDAIIEDLTFAVNNNADVKKHIYVTKTTAKALLAKVFLYKKEYKKAQELAKEVITANTGGYGLESTYPNIYIKKWKSSEVLFAPFSDSKNEFFLETENYGDGVIQPAESFRKIADNQVEGFADVVKNSSGYDPRFIFSYNRPLGKPNRLNFKYPFDDDNTIYYIRLAEVYLIYAEAYVRNTENATYTEAVNAVNAIRNRANEGVSPKGKIKPISQTLTKAKLLEKIREEKMLELFLETGETWFDIVRYIDLGDLSFDVKKTLTKKEQLIFPIPLRAIEGNHNLVQNPGYN